MRCLRNGHADRRDGLRVQVIRRHRALRLAYREQPDLVPEFLQPPGEVIDDDLGPAVSGRRYWHPRRGNQADSHLHCLLVSSCVTITLRQDPGSKAPAPGECWARADHPRRWPGAPGWRSAWRHGHTAARGMRPVVPVVATESRLRALCTRGEVPELIGAAPITVRMEPLTECNLPGGKARQTSAVGKMIISRGGPGWLPTAALASDLRLLARTSRSGQDIRSERPRQHRAKFVV